MLYLYHVIRENNHSYSERDREEIYLAIGVMGSIPGNRRRQFEADYALLFFLFLEGEG